MMLLRTQMLRKIIWVVNPELLHHLLLFGRPWLASRERHFYLWRWLRSNWSPLVKLLAEEVRFMCQQDVGALQLTEIKALRNELVWA